MFITSSPTLLPSLSPITSTPTASPLFMGMVISVDISTPTSSAINNAEIEELEAIVADSYGVDNEDVSSVTEYVTSGTLEITIPDTISEEEALEELTSALSTTLGINKDSISLSLDPESGEVFYMVTTDDYDRTNEVLLDLLSDDIIDSLDTSVVTIDSVNPSDEIVAEVNIMVNAEEVEVSLQQAENRINALLDDHYTSSISGNFFNQFLLKIF